MTIKQVTERLITWNSATRTQRLMSQIRRKYIGQGVIETLPFGGKVHGYIVDMQWESSVGLDGAWCCFVEYTEGAMVGYGSWTDCSVLELTGSKRS